MSTIAPDEGDEPPPAAPKWSSSVEEKQREAIKDLRKILAARTKGLKKEHPKYARAMRTTTQQGEELCELKD
jgi:hypothetical protein